MRHTKGKLEIRTYDGSIGSIDSEGGDMVAQAMQVPGDTLTQETRKANTRRLVACWNKLHRYPTEIIETSADVLVPQSMVDSAAKAFKERDEALAVLRNLAGWADKYIGSHMFHLSELGEIVGDSKAILSRYQEEE